MLAGLLAPHIQGRYSLIHVPISLPLTVLDLLPSLQTTTLHRTSTSELPPAAPGCAWAVLQAGQQIATGVPGGRNTFYEAKLEFPFLQIGTKSTTTVTFKQHLNFSSSLMSYSASIINGLSTSRDEFQVEMKDGRERFEVKGWLVVEELAFDESRSEGAGWSIQETREQMQGWWIGPKSGSKLSCFNTTSLALPVHLPRLRISVNLPLYLRLSHQVLQQALTANQGPLGMDEEGWCIFEAAGWKLDEGTSMEIRELSSF